MTTTPCTTGVVTTGGANKGAAKELTFCTSRVTLAGHSEGPYGVWCVGDVPLTFAPFVPCEQSYMVHRHNQHWVVTAADHQSDTPAPVHPRAV